MSSPDPSPPPSPRGSNGADRVAVATSVERALADVERQLVRQAGSLRVSLPSALQQGATPVTLMAAPVGAAPAAPPSAPRRSRRGKARPAGPRPAPVGPVRRPPPPLPPPTSRTRELDELIEDEHAYDDLFADDISADELDEIDEVGERRELETQAYDDSTSPTGSTGAAAARVRPSRQAVARRVDVDELTRAQRAAVGALQARKVRRIVRDVSPWSVFKFSVLFNVCVWLILLIAGVILWRVGQSSGVVTNMEKFYAKAAGEESFELDGRAVFRAAAGAGVVLIVALTGVSVLIAVLFNLITDLTGGIRLSVVELESARRPLRRRDAADAVKDRSRIGAPAGRGITGTSITGTSIAGTSITDAATTVAVFDESPPDEPPGSTDEREASSTPVRAGRAVIEPDDDQVPSVVR